MIYFREFPKFTANDRFLYDLTTRVIEKNQWQAIRRLERSENFHVELNPMDTALDTDMSRMREYFQKTVYAYRLTEDELKEAGVKAKTAWLFKTNPNTRVYIHRENRSVALNFPIMYEPDKSHVGFFDEQCNELTRHELIASIPVYYNVIHWHTVVNESLTTPRVVLTCSDLTDDWLESINELQNS